ncbi:FAD-dependent cmnm(5)s(2)U34 oxidoreductase [Rhodoferax lacus]|uniref:FAD-dependent cmnm(5)s(2)U34 oxidoreductase n=1 Tax=Rhodoferax lacus TaxID=2184758 RepID=A0A3E1RGS0_9BURK|nr:FAD-dependent oxidoreductase [Rhodoferax lacus]RFO98576.1 FAD-dependent cmnm(5)s(2)U34 oxidoreductase [Rhodoferax lacus]
MPATVPALQPVHGFSFASVAAAWSSQASWTVLDTGFGSGHTFLNLWQTWRAHAHKPGVLHCVGILSLAEAQALASGLTGATPHSLFQDLASALAAQCYDLEPGFQRLLLDGGTLSLTLCVGTPAAMLAKQDMQADTVLLAGAQDWDKWQIKALARCCKRGAGVLFAHGTHPNPELLADAGFAPDAEGLPLAVYNPRWQLRSERKGAGAGAGAGATADAAAPGRERAPRCAVIGAGIAGASVARALALRGFRVDVYDAQPHPAGGASGLPIGLVVPHHSADDSPRSRLSRQGTRLMLQQARQLLLQGQDWNPGGVLERTLGPDGLAEDEAEVLSQTGTLPATTGWARPMDYGDAPGLWHPHAAWIKPAPLVQQWLDHPHIRYHGQAAVHTLERASAQWLLRSAGGLELGRADHVVLANASGSADLVLRTAQQLQAKGAAGFSWVPDVLDKLRALQSLHGTLSHGPMPVAGSGADHTSAWPTFPVNGHGSWASGIHTESGPHWYAGSTFRSDAQEHADIPQEHAANFHKLQTLLPDVARAVWPQFDSQQVQAWQGSRCVTHDRLPLVGPLQEAEQPALWLCAGMGARGLSFSALCAELLAAWMCGEPLPVENNLARSLDTRRPRRTRAAQQRTQAP